MFWSRKKPITMETTTKHEYRIPDDKLEELCGLWDACVVNGNATQPRLRLWRFIQTIFPHLDIYNGVWRLKNDGPLRFYIYERKNEEND